MYRPSALLDPLLDLGENSLEKDWFEDERAVLPLYGGFETQPDLLLKASPSTLSPFESEQQEEER
mgnify:CR=1 FL=1